MTIVNSYQNKRSFTLPISCLAVLLIASVFLGLFWYNQIVNLTHELETSGRHIQKIQALNAELKQKVYNLVSYENLEKIAGERNLIKEKNPEYLNLSQSDTQWLFASHY